MLNIFCWLCNWWLIEVLSCLFLALIMHQPLITIISTGVFEIGSFVFFKSDMSSRKAFRNIVQKTMQYIFSQKSTCLKSEIVKLNSNIRKGIERFFVEVFNLWMMLALCLLWERSYKWNEWLSSSYVDPLFQLRKRIWYSLRSQKR